MGKVTPSDAPLFKVAIATGFLYGAHTACMPLLPLKAAAFGWSPGSIGLLVASYVAAAAVVRILCPAWLPVWPVKNWFAVSAALLLACCAYYALFPASWLFFVVRAVQGIAFAIFTTAAYSWVGTVTADRNRGRGIAIIGMAMSLALVFAPPLAIWSEAQGRGSGFWLAAFLALMAVPFATGGQIGVLRPQREQLGRAVSFTLLGIALAGAAIGIVEAFGPLVIVQRELGSVAALIALFGLFMVLGRFGGGWLSDKANRFSVAAGAAAILAAAMALYPLVWTPVAAAIVTPAIGFAAGASLSAMATLVSSMSNSAAQVRAMAAVTLAADLGIVAGSFLAGTATVWGQPGWAGAAIMTAGGCILVAAGLLVMRAFMSPFGHGDGPLVETK